MTKLASAVTAYTPQHPIPTDQADKIRDLVSARLHALAVEVDAELQAQAAKRGGGGEEEVIIVTSPPPP